MKAKSFLDRLTVAVAALLIAALAIALPLLPKKEFSEKERRALAPFPTLRMETLFDGRFFGAISDFYADHFPLREGWTALKATCERALGKRENNGILFGRDGYLIARGEYEDLSVASENLTSIRALCGSSDAPVTVSILPRALDVLTAYLPRGYDASRAGEIHVLIQNTVPQNVDLMPTLRAASKYGQAVFYRTDHHWTTSAAYLAYAELAPSLGIEPYPAEFFTQESATNQFYGTAAARAALPDTVADEILLYRYEGDDRYTVTVSETGTSLSSLYDKEAAVGEDPYAVFLGGNYARLEIVDGQTPDKPMLLLFKDSFANSLIPFLALHFQLTVIDPRYEPTGAEALLREISPDRVLVLVGADTLATTPALARLGR